MRLKGLEPSRRKTPDPKSGASASSATSAICECKGKKKNIITCSLPCFFYKQEYFFSLLDGFRWVLSSTFQQFAGIVDDRVLAFLEVAVLQENGVIGCDTEFSVVLFTVVHGAG